MGTVHFELQAWLGHRTRPALREDHIKNADQGNTQAGYFSRNLRTIEVLVGRDAVASGAVAGGEPW